MPENAFDIGQKDVPIAQAGLERSAAGLPPPLRLCELGPPSTTGAAGALGVPRYPVMLLNLPSCKHLYHLFWPDIPEGTTHHNVNRILSHLDCFLTAPHGWLKLAAFISLNLQQIWSENIDIDYSSLPWLFYGDDLK